MKVRVWKEQIELFELSVLEQTCELVVCDLEELSTPDLDNPTVLVGRAFASKHEEAVRRIVNGAYKSKRALLVVPPLSDSDLERYIDAPVSVRAVRRPTNAAMKIVDPEWSSRIGPELAVRSDLVLETSLTAGTMVVDSAGGTTMLRYRPRNTAGAVFISTMQLLSYTALSKESDRQALLRCVLEWQASSALEGESPKTDGVQPRSHVPEPDDVTITLLAIVAANTVDKGSVLNVINEHLGRSLDEERLAQVIDWLGNEGALSVNADGTHSLSKEGLHSAIDERGLHAYARELQEMVASQKESGQ